MLDGNSAELASPDPDKNDDEEVENVGCGFLGLLREGQTGLSITNVIIRNHHRAGIRIVGPRPGDDPIKPKPNEVEVIGCRIVGCGSRGVVLTRATRARIAGNTIISCTQAGIQLVRSRTAVIDGNVIQKTARRDVPTAGTASPLRTPSTTSSSTTWRARTIGGASSPRAESGSRRRRASPCRSTSWCRTTSAAPIPWAASRSIRPPGTKRNPTGVIHDSFATVASNVCVGNHGRGIQTIHAGYVAVHGNVCDNNDHIRDDDKDSSDGIGIISSRYAVVADNVLTANRYGVAFLGDPSGAAGHTRTRHGPPPSWRQRVRQEQGAIRSTSATPIRRSGSCTISGPTATPVA